MSACFASIDLGGTNMHAAITDGDGVSLAEAKEPTLSHEGADSVLQRMAALVQRLSKDAGVAPKALGIGMPGLVDVAAGVTKFLPNLPGLWRDVRVRDVLQPLVDCPVYLLNDARAATLGELVFGHGRDVSDMVFFTIGTGVGGGVVIDGKLRLGPLGAAGELGHTTVLTDGLPCSCGSRGCLETVASGPALTAEGVRLMLSGSAPVLYRICDGDAAKVSPRSMGEAAAQGEVTVLAAIERIGAWLGIAAATMVSALHPQLVVLGGGVAELGELLLKPVRETMRRRVGMFPTNDVRVEQSKLGDRAGLLGGIALAMQKGITRN